MAIQDHGVFQRHDRAASGDGAAPPGVLRGRVTVEETGVGIPGLVVSGYDSIAAGSGRASSPSEDVSADSRPLGVRLGSVLTDPAGWFELPYRPLAPRETPDVAVPASDNPGQPATAGKQADRIVDLVIEVRAPDVAGRAGEARGGAGLYVSPRVRGRAGRTEVFAVRIPRALLEDAGVVPPTEPDEPESVVAVLERTDAAAAAFDSGVRSIAARRVQTERDARATYEQGFEARLRRSLSRVPATLVRPDRLIAAGESVGAKNEAAIGEGVTEQMSQASAERLRLRGRLFLDPAQQQRLADIAGNDADAVVDSAALKRLLLRTEDDGTPPPEPPIVLVKEEDLFAEFLEQTHAERCAGDLLDITPETPDEPDAGNEEDGADGDVVAGHIETLTGELTGPERLDGVLGGGRSNADTVQASVDQLSLRPGPADSPAFFDFHRLQIAFDDVWQELLDDDAVELARAAYTRIVDLGGDPDHASHAGKPPLTALSAEAEVVSRALTRPGAPLNPRGTTFAMRRRLDTDDPLGDRPVDVPPPPPPQPSPPPTVPPWFPHPVPPVEIDTPGEVHVDVRPSDLVGRLREMLRQAYSFTAYGAGPGEHAVNFGIVTTFRQRWEPVAYQAGELVRTIPLAPGESRKYTRKTTIRRKRAEKELQRWSELRREELTETSRAEWEIVRKATAKTNFSLTAEGTYNLGIASGESTVRAGRDAGQDSQDTKKDFRQAVAKAAQEYKQERSVEISTEESDELETSESGEIRNPNDELAVTCLFYELQRRYRINEELHRVTPVVLVAQEIPNPREITDAWLVAHDWILRRVILDEAFLPALRYLSSHVAGDEVALQAMRQTMEEHRANVAELRRDLVALEEQAGRRFQAALEAMERRADLIEEEETEGFFESFGESLGFGDGESVEAARVREEAARTAEQQATEEVKKLSLRLQREVTALDAATERYTKASADHRNRQVQIDRLRLHVKDNIIYYMQAVWAFEAADQRFLRLREMPAPAFHEGPQGSAFRLVRRPEVTRVDAVRDGAVLASTGYDIEADPDLAVTFGEQTLEQVADLHTLLGFHGNYLIFPLKEGNPLTDFMTAPYVDSGWQLIDPDQSAGALSRADFARYVCHLHETLSAEQFAAIKPALKERYEEILTSPTRAGEEIIVPTGSLFIELLPGTHTLLEDFKLAHRAVDVKKVQAQVREAELDNVRRVARLLTGDLADPDIESIKHVAIQGDGAQPVIDVDDE